MLIEGFGLCSGFRVLRGWSLNVEEPVYTAMVLSFLLLRVGL